MGVRVAGPRKNHVHSTCTFPALRLRRLRQRLGSRLENTRILSANDTSGVFEGSIWECEEGRGRKKKKKKDRERERGREKRRGLWYR